MKIQLIIISLFLTGCTTAVVPVTQKFPEPYSIGVKKEIPQCEMLSVQDGDNVPITDFLDTIVKNYKLFYDCKDHVDNWNKWYQKQKEIFEKTNK